GERSASRPGNAIGGLELEGPQSLQEVISVEQAQSDINRPGGQVGASPTAAPPLILWAIGVESGRDDRPPGTVPPMSRPKERSPAGRNRRASRPPLPESHPTTGTNAREKGWTWRR